MRREQAIEAHAKRLQYGLVPFAWIDRWVAFELAAIWFRDKRKDRACSFLSSNGFQFRADARYSPSPLQTPIEDVVQCSVLERIAVRDPVLGAETHRSGPDCG